MHAPAPRPLPVALTLETPPAALGPHLLVLSIPCQPEASPAAAPLSWEDLLGER